MRRYEKFLNQRSVAEDLLGLYVALMNPSPTLFISLLPNIFPNKLAPNVPNSIPRNPPLFSELHFELFR